MVLEILFWLSLGLTVYTYAVYPLLLMLLRSPREKSENPRTSASLPEVSIVISVFNEEGVLERKLQNLRETDYPEDRLEILIGSDGSTDMTNTLLESAGMSNLRT
ncbi:MAG: glycosyltransferase, partial [Bacteroidota bacterium]